MPSKLMVQPAAPVGVVEVIEEHDLFGQYGRILNVSVPKGRAAKKSATAVVYITYSSETEATSAINSANGFQIEDNVRMIVGTCT